MMMTLPKEQSFSWMAKLKHGGIFACFAVFALYRLFKSDWDR